MGAQESVKPARTPYPYDRPVRLIMAGSSWATLPDYLVNKFLGYGYKETPPSNIKWDIKSRTLTIDGNRVCLGVEVVSSIFRSVLRLNLAARGVGFMLLYDETDEESFETAKDIVLAEVSPEMPMVLVGCQCQQKQRRRVSYHTAREFADERGIPVVEVCGEEGVNVELAFMTLVGECFSRNR